MRTRFTAIIAVLMSFVPLQGQQSHAQLSVTELLSKLHSATWQERSEAYEQLSSSPSTLSSPKVRASLLDLLDRENKALDAETRRSASGKATDRDAEEGNAEYLAKLQETVDSFADWNDQRQACILVGSSYNPESEFGAKIAAHAKVTVPCLLQMSNSDIGADRAQAIPVLVQALAKAKADLDTRYLEAAKAQISNGLHDQDAVVRGETVIALGAFGSPDMIPALENVARSDPGSDTRSDNGAEWFPIREEAKKAIALIKQRQEQK